MRVYNARDVPNMEIAEKINAGFALSPVRGGESAAVPQAGWGEWNGAAVREYRLKSYINVVFEK